MVIQVKAMWNGRKKKFTVFWILRLDFAVVTANSKVYQKRPAVFILAVCAADAVIIQTLSLFPSRPLWPVCPGLCLWLSLHVCLSVCVHVSVRLMCFVETPIAHMARRLHLHHRYK